MAGPNNRPAITVTRIQVSTWVIWAVRSPAKSWLDLRRQNDYEGISFTTDLTARDLSLVATLAKDILYQALDCVANADDTTRQQERLIRDQRAALRCL